MNTRLILSHLGVAILAFTLGYFVLGSRESDLGPIARPEDPIAAFTEALAIEEPHARAQALLDFFAVADPAWAERLRAEVNQPGSKLALDEIGETLFASWWARSDPQAAFANLVDPAWANRHPWLRQVMRAWVVADPTRAAEAAASLPPNPDRGKIEATREVVEHWWDTPVSTDPAPLFVLLHELPVTPRGFSIQRLLETSIERRGIDATEQFVESLPKQDDFGVNLPQEISARYGQILIDHDVERAVLWAAKHGQGREGSGILLHLAFSWGSKNGPAAMQWATSLPESPQRPGIIMRAWLSFRGAQADEAAQWLEAREPDLILEEVFNRYLAGTASIDPSKALEIAGRAKDPMLRERLLAAVGGGWMKQDPEAAQKWLDTVELAPELEERVRQSRPFDPAERLNPVNGG